MGSMPRTAPERGTLEWMTLPLLVALASAVQPQSPAVPRMGVDGPEHTTIDLIRPAEGFPRIYVQATLPDGESALFLVDTGADISVISEETAERLALPVDRSWGMLSGLSGNTPMHRSVLPSATFGDVTVHDIEVAVGVPGVSERVGFMPVDGLLGNNVWGRFLLEIDYPGAVMGLHAPGSVRLPRSASPMHFDGRHIFAPAVVTTEGGDIVDTLIAQLDTGASGLTLCAATGLPFAERTTEGLETLRGIGASERIPPYRFLETTKRIPLQRLELGGATAKPPGASARWVDFEQLHTPTCRSGMRALLGQEYMASHRVLVDYAGGRLALTRSKRRKRVVNGHEVLYDQDVARYGPDATDRDLVRGRLLLGMEEELRATALLEAYAKNPDAPPEEAAEARMLLSALARQEGDLARSRRFLSDMSPADLVEQEQIIASVNGLLFDDRADEALALAEQAVAARGDEGDAYVALADALLAVGRPDDASAALLRAADLEQYPDAHLLRRARVALAAGDRHGAMAHVRKLLQHYPFGGHLLWFYAQLLETDGDRSTFRADMDHAMARLHPDARPFDFLVAANRILGDEAQTLAYREQGLAEHCAIMKAGPSAENCRAWYDALAGVDLDKALERIDHALAEEGDRSDFLDTKAMVHLARHEPEQAKSAALQAARMSPDDVYMLWQAERISDIADRDAAASVPAAAKEAR